MTMTYARPIPRQDLCSYVEYLSRTYPKCFFVDARMKRPLKKGIVLDLQRERVLDDEKITAAVNFYTNDWGYQRVLQAGVERVDLNGRQITRSYRIARRRRVPSGGAEIYFNMTRPTAPGGRPLGSHLMPYEIDVLPIGDKKSGDTLCVRYGSPQIGYSVIAIDGVCHCNLVS